MNLPISTIGAVAGAAKLAQEVAAGISRGVSEAMGFHEVLKQGDTPDAETLATELVQKIENRLSESGILVNQDLPIQVTDDGQLRIEIDHERAAEIESILKSDREIGEIAKRLAGSESATGLTIRTDRANIQYSSGGYPNW